jgi:hypothetical protein
VKAYHGTRYRAAGLAVTSTAKVRARASGAGSIDRPFALQNLNVEKCDLSRRQDEKRCNQRSRERSLFHTELLSFHL